MKRTIVWCLIIVISVLAVTESAFFVDDEPPIGLPDTGRGIDYAIGTPPSFVSLFDPDTSTPFYSAYKVLPGQAGKWNDPPGT